MLQAQHSSFRKSTASPSPWEAIDVTVRIEPLQPAQEVLLFPGQIRKPSQQYSWLKASAAMPQDAQLSESPTPMDPEGTKDLMAHLRALRLARALERANSQRYGRVRIQL